MLTDLFTVKMYKNTKKNVSPHNESGLIPSEPARSEFMGCTFLLGHDCGSTWQDFLNLVDRCLGTTDHPDCLQTIAVFE